MPTLAPCLLLRNRLLRLAAAAACRSGHTHTAAAGCCRTLRPTGPCGGLHVASASTMEASAPTTFRVLGRDGPTVRTGVLTVPSKVNVPLATPNCLMVTKQGHPPHLTGSMLHDLEGFQGVLFNMGGLWSHPTPKGLKTFGKGLGAFTHLEDKLIVCTVPDPLTPQPDGNNEAEVVSVWSHGGRKGINVDDYMGMMKSARPDIILSIADYQSCKAGRKRQSRSMQRSKQMLEQTVSRMRTWGADMPLLFGSVVGGGQVEYREGSAVAAAAEDLVAGFSIEGLNMGETQESRDDMVRTIVTALPEDKPRAALSLSTPEDVLQAISLGVDIFGSQYPLTMAERGHAITFSFGAAPGSASVFRDINLTLEAYRRDFTPLLPGCTCYACKRHTKAYIYHLLFTQEMLAEVLLTHHNFHQYYLFYEGIRRSILGGTFAAEHLAFVEAYPAPSAEDMEAEDNARKRKVEKDREWQDKRPTADR